MPDFQSNGAPVQLPPYDQKLIQNQLGILGQFVIITDGAAQNVTFENDDIVVTGATMTDIGRITALKAKYCAEAIRSMCISCVEVSGQDAMSAPTEGLASNGLIKLIAEDGTNVECVDHYRGTVDGQPIFGQHTEIDVAASAPAGITLACHISWIVA